LRGKGNGLITVGRLLIAAIFFGVLHLLHPLGVPGVPLAKQTRVAAAYLGTLILLLVVGYYGPMLIGDLADPSTAAKIEGLNFFADTLLFGGTILSLALLGFAAD
jgi:hypothetical protein